MRDWVAMPVILLCAISAVATVWCFVLHSDGPLGPELVFLLTGNIGVSVIMGGFAWFWRKHMICSIVVLLASIPICWFSRVIIHLGCELNRPPTTLSCGPPAVLVVPLLQWFALTLVLPTTALVYWFCNWISAEQGLTENQTERQRPSYEIKKVEAGDQSSLLGQLLSVPAVTLCAINILANIISLAIVLIRFPTDTAGHSALVRSVPYAMFAIAAWQWRGNSYSSGVTLLSVIWMSLSNLQMNLACLQSVHNPAFNGDVSLLGLMQWFWVSALLIVGFVVHSLSSESSNAEEIPRTKPNL